MSEPTDPMPVFVIKAKDALALATIERYRRLHRSSARPICPQCRGEAA